MKNPVSAIDAITTPGERPVGRFVVREITLGTLAILERLSMQTPSGNTDGTWMPVIERYYAMTHSAKDCGKLLSDGIDCYRAAALEWASDITPSEIQALTECCNAATARLRAATAATTGNAAEGSEQNPTVATQTGG